MAFEELKKAFISVLEEEEKKEKESKPVKTKPKKTKKVKEKQIIEPKDWATEVYRAFYLIISGRTIRGSKETALKSLIQTLTEKLVKESGKNETINFLKGLISQLEAKE